MTGADCTREDVEVLMEPYVRRSPKWNAYEVVRTAFAAVLLLPVRLLFLGLAGLVVWLLSALAMIGVPKSKRAKFVFTPLHPVRNFFIRAMYPVIRAIAFVSFGVLRVELKRAPKKDDAPKAFVVVSNHLGYVDIIILSCVYRASFVSKGDFERLPIISSIALAMQTMFVRPNESLTTKLIDRVQTTHDCHEKMAKTDRASPACLNKLVIFSEGTTTNGKSMVAFRTGVFNAGKPVQPVCVSFPHKRWNMSWETIRFREHLFRTMTQLYNRVTVTELPVYVPSEAEVADARLFASNVQQAMADELQQRVYLLNRKHKFLYHRYVCGKIDANEVRQEADKLSSDDSLLSYLAEREAQDVV